MVRGRQRISQKSEKSWFDDYISLRNSPDRENVIASEWRLALFGLVFSLSVLAAKVFYANRYGVYNLFVERRLMTYETLVTDGDVMLKYAWTNVLKYSYFWFPALCGGLATWFTWIMVYLDSSVPGVQPPSPFSSSKYKERSGHTFHLNYVFAVVVGLFVFIYMYYRGATLLL